ncbi:hypothetical protein CALCODRAFT_503129 [Calocera cornea HHB12733]|uniref:Uncharacterized protein n=1 Tax=Calocera cornea HHB12733 TaxID=1353952 RepID=A0A165CZS2_9BASI|nr:hypothetical protein CALCODRAFT_503129 [Calocera cornea HHB12733]
MGVKRKVDDTDDAHSTTATKRSKVDVPGDPTNDAIAVDSAVLVDTRVDVTVTAPSAIQGQPIAEIDTLPTTSKSANAPKKKHRKKPESTVQVPSKGPLAPPARISKLNPAKPQIEDGDKTTICVTRQTKLGAYLRRCRRLFDDGHASITLYAMGAAIPHLALLTTSLPLVLPGGVLRQEVTTSTVTCVDEIEPEDEDVEGGLRKREKAGMRVVLWMREEGGREGAKGRGMGKGGMGKAGRGGRGGRRGGKGAGRRDAMDVS